MTISKPCYFFHRIIIMMMLYLALPKADGQNSISTRDSVTVAIESSYDSVNNFHRFWLGEGYRKLWAAPVKLRVLHLGNEKGGLTILQAGGGLQTKSLRLKDASGKQWVLRSIQKFPERRLPENLRKTIAKNILQDQVITSHPYAALTVPTFAEALGIPHTNPEIVFVPDDPLFGAYRNDFSNTVFLFEERDPADSLKTVSTEKVQAELEEDNDEKVDQKLVLRARLLDMLLGDWDRHEDQWRWERNKEFKGAINNPLPRDRDNVYYNTTGVLPWIVTHQWTMSRLQGFHEQIRDVEGYNFNNRFFDRYFLNRLNEEEWKEQINFIQKIITDSLIKIAVRKFPDTIYSLSGGWIIKTLIKRRSNLEKTALEYYRFISKYVDVPGSDKHEEFVITNEDVAVHLVIYKIKKEGTRENIIYDRKFSADVTKEIRLYGLDGQDIFSVNGTGASIKIRMIGGDGRDSFYIDNNVSNKNKLFIYDRSDQENAIPENGVRLRTSTDSAVNDFDKHAFQNNYLGPAFAGHYNSDQGSFFRLGFIYEKHGFRKEPYAARHELFANYSAGTSSFLFTYNTELIKIFGKTDLHFNIISYGPKNAGNFFGVGNETVFVNANGKRIDYYQNRFDHVDGDVRLKWNLTSNWKLSAGLAAEYYTSSKKTNQNLFLNEYANANPGANVFSNRFYGGLVASTSLNNRNNTNPASGWYWNVEAKLMKHLNENNKSYGQLFSEFSFSLPLFKDSNLVIANRVGGGTTFGSPLFFQQMQLGGTQNLRGFHSLRFTGKSMFYHNIDLRIKLFDFVSYLFPGRVGLIVFNDVGRVWVTKKSSSVWHHGYGGGFYIIPAKLVSVQVLVAHSKEGTQPYVSVGFGF